jgi:uncharacterized protein with von Willebrand factor type A (vWA) domain
MGMDCMDCSTIELSKGGEKNILVMTDYFTKFTVAVPKRNQSSKTTYDAFFHSFMISYRFPDELQRIFAV